MKFLVLIIVSINLLLSFENEKVKFYKNKTNSIVGITNKIIVKLDNNQTINKYLDDFNLTKIKKIGKNLFLVKVSDNNQTLKVSNQLIQMEGVKYAHPDFIKRIIKR